MKEIIASALILLFMFEVKHIFADVVFQTDYMSDGKRLKGFAFIAPLALHAGLHGATTFALCFFWTTPTRAALYAFGDAVAHFAIDRVKALLELVSKKPTDSDRLFWLINGLDQGAHHITYYVIVYLVLWK